MKKEKTKKIKEIKKKKKNLFDDFKSIYRNLQDKDKLLKKTILPIIFLGLLIAFIPFLNFFIHIMQIPFHPISFVLLGMFQNEDYNNKI